MEKWKAEREARLARGEKEEEEEEEEEINIYAVTEEEVLVGSEDPPGAHLPSALSCEAWTFWEGCRCRSNLATAFCLAWGLLVGATK